MRRELRTARSLVLAAVTFAACGDARRDDALVVDPMGAGDDGGGGDDAADDAADSGGEKLDVAAGGATGDGGDAGDGAVASCAEAESELGTIGCAFVAVDLPNVWAHSILSAPDTAIPAEQQFALVVANATYETPAHVTVTLDGQMVDTATVDVGQMHTFELPRNDIDAQTSTTAGTAFLVESDMPIVAYQFQPLDNLPPPYSNDASLLFPIHTFSTQYTATTSYATAMTVQGGPTHSVNIGSFVTVVAVEDDTVVDLYPTAPLAGSPATADVVLQRGQVLNVIGDGETIDGQGNLSGTRVSATKPVAVFSGNVGAHEPLDVSGCCLDHVEHQMLPMDAWSDTYFAVPPPRYDGKVDEWAVYRIVGAFDGTTLHYTPSAPSGAPTTIDAGEVAELKTTGPYVISGSHPFSLVEFLFSNQSLGHDAAVPGDPAMWVIPPVDQFQQSYVFLAPEGYAASFVTVVGRAGQELLLDGEPITGQFVMTGSLDGQAYAHIHVPIAPGSHTVEADDPIGIAVFGYGTDVSYAYPGGSGIRKLYTPPPPPEG
jgi:hypothetical protein